MNDCQINRIFQTWNFVLLLTLCLSLSSCDNHNNSHTLSKLSESELVAMYQTFSVPSFDSLLVKDTLNEVISIDSLHLLKNNDHYTLDYYKNSEGKIKEAVLRVKTPEDERIARKIFASELQQNEREEIDMLSTIELKNSYLTNLWDQDQGIREGQDSKIMLKHGLNSKEHKEHKASFIRTDKKLFAKIKYYLERHGYPKDKERYHWKAINSFQTIIGHNHNYEQQELMLLLLIESYKKGYCDKSELVWILGEMHESKYNGKRYKMKSKIYTIDQEFLELCDVLQIQIGLDDDE